MHDAIEFGGKSANLHLCKYVIYLPIMQIVNCVIKRLSVVGVVINKNAAAYITLMLLVANFGNTK